METIECKHKEMVKTLGHGIDLGVCTECKQEVRYNVDKLHERPTVLKLGRIGGRLVLPNHDYKLLLNPQDQADLVAAKAAPAAVKHPAAVAPGRPDKEETPWARIKWYRDHKQEMIKDLIAMGTKAFLEKWKVKPQLISHLKGDKLYKKLAKVPGTKALQQKQPLGDKLPTLPPWSNDWVPEVQVRWLDIYEKLITPGGIR